MVDHEPSSGTPSPDPRGDGVRIIKRSDPRSGNRRFSWVVVAVIGVCVVSGALLLWPKPAVHHASSDATTNNIGADNVDPDPGADMTAGGEGAMPANPPRLAAADDISNYIAPGEAPPMADVIARLNKVGVHTGLGAFPAPGTSPPMVGLAVPEGFDLPEGYVRHYQATDDGQRIDPILMFSPDFEFLDAAGQPIRLPTDMVVRPNMAPPGLPIRLIKIPPPVAATGLPA